MHLHHALFLLDQVLIQPGVLDGDDGLTADDVEQVFAVGGEVVGVGVRKEHRAVDVESTAQGEAVCDGAISQGHHPSEFRVVADVAREDRLTLVEDVLEDALAAVERHTQIGIGETPRRLGLQQAPLEEQNGSHQAVLGGLLGIRRQGGEGHVQRGVENALVTESRRQGGGQLIDGAQAVGLDAPLLFLSIQPVEAHPPHANDDLTSQKAEQDAHQQKNQGFDQRDGLGGGPQDEEVQIEQDHIGRG